MTPRRIFEFHKKIMGKPAWIVGAFALLAPFLIYGLTRLEVSLSLYHQVDSQMASTLSLDQMKKDFSDGMSATFIIAPPADQEGFSSEQFCAIRKFLQVKRPEVRLLSLFDVRRPQLIDSRLYYFPLLPDTCENPQPPAFEKHLAESPWIGTLTDLRARDFAFEATFDDRDPHWPERFGELWTELKASLPSDLLIYINGRAASYWFYQGTLSSDLWVHGVLLCLLIGLFRLFFGTWVAGCLYLLTLGITTFVILGLMGLTGSPIDVLNNSLFLITAVAAAEDFIFLSAYRMRTQGSFRRPYVAILLPAFWTSLTTALGFASLALSPTLMLRRFGLWAAAAAMIEWFVIFALLPVITGKMKGKTWVSEERAFRIPALRLQALGNLPRPLSRFLLVGCLLLGIFGYERISIDRPERLFGSDHPLTESILYVSHSRGGEAPLYLLFPETATPDIKQQILSKIQTLPSVASLVTHDQILSYFTRDLDPLTARLAHTEMEVMPSLRSLKRRDGQERVPVLLRKIDVQFLAQAITELRQVCGSACQPVGEVVVYADYMQRIGTSLREGFILSGILVGLTLFFLARSFKLSTRIQLVLSALWGPLTLYGFAWLTHWPVDFLSNMVGAILVGITGDNAVQFIYASRGQGLRQGVDRQAKASFITFVVTTCGSLSLCLLSIVPMQRLGVLIAVGFVFSYFGDFILLRSLINDRKQKHR